MNWLAGLLELAGWLEQAAWLEMAGWFAGTGCLVGNGCLAVASLQFTPRHAVTYCRQVDEPGMGWWWLGGGVRGS